MKRLFLFAVLCCLLSTGLLGYDLSRLDSLFTDSLEVFNENVTVIFKHGDSIIYEFQNGSIGPDTIAGLASASKWISGAIILELAHEGFYDMGDTIGMYLPIFSDYGRGQPTIRHCFSMSSGIFGDQNYQRNAFMTLEESVDSIARYVPLIFEPGEGIAYDGKGQQVVGRIAEIATGMDWRDIADEYLLIPCGMTNTSYTDFGALNPGVPGGVRSTANDYLKFLTMIHNGGMHEGTRVLSEWTIEHLFENPTHGVEIFHSPWPTSPHYPYGIEGPEYAIGSWVLAQHPVTDYVEEISSPGAYGTMPWFDRSRGLYGVIFTHLYPGFATAGQTDLYALKILRDIYDNNDPDARIIRISPFEENYLDFEIQSDYNFMNFCESNNLTWLAELDPYTGRFVSEDGRDMVIDTISPLILSNNGPEFAIDTGGLSLIYSKDDGEYAQLFIADFTGDGFIRRQLTFNDHHHYSGLASQDEDNPYVHIGFINNYHAIGDITWISEEDPSNEIYLAEYERGSTPFRWSPDSRYCVFVNMDHADQISMYDTETDSAWIITNDPTPKLDPTIFRAPEFDDEIVMTAIAAQETLILYRDLGGEYWEAVSKMPIPEESEYDILQSPEFFSFRGKSYHSLHIEQGEGDVGIPLGEVWVFGLDDTEPFYLRCDDELPGIRRTDPETYVGAEDVFVYYTVWDGDAGWEIWRCKTGMEDILAVSIDNDRQNLNQPKKLRIISYPNPFNSKIQFVLPSGYTISGIYDINGNLAYRPDGNSWQPKNDIESGIYIIHADDGLNQINHKVVYLK